MEQIKIFIITFLLVYSIYLFALILRKKKSDKLEYSMELKYLKLRYKVDIKKINMKYMVQIISISNAFIIASTFTLISFIDQLIIKMLFGFIILIILEIAVYHIIGKYYQHQERGDKNV
ncbi:MAG: hypothetical protein PHW32_02860 [Bacilli bacterium]|nr:hypothetical protein [Bacilli bacterium]MDD4282464.1 hypothetical protein [Bacilli bacterium]MDD4718939.1 hypothetical protein [Bacilli bacterium]